MFTGVEIFKAGEHVSSEGVRRTFTEADLDKIAGYDSTKHEAPVVVGHPKDNAPAYGWVGKVYRQGKLLLADFSDVDPGFADLVKAGRFKKRSISLYPDGTLRHVGFLGAVPPAIKGLKDVAFAEGQAMTFEEDFRVSTLARIMVRLRDWLIAKFGQDAADQVMSTWDVESVLDQPDNPAEPTAAFQEEDMALDAETKKQLDELTGQMTQFSEQLKAKDKQISDLQQANQALAAQVASTSGVMLQKDFTSFAEANLARILPANKARTVAIMDALAKSQPVNFAEEGQGAKDRSPLELFREMVANLPEQVEFAELATKGRAVAKPGGLDGQALAQKITEKCQSAEKAGQVMSFSEAQALVLKEQEGAK